MAESEEIDIPGTKRDFAIFILVNLGIGFLLYSVLTNVAQTIARTVFIATVIGTLMFWRFRVVIAFVGITILLLTRTIDLEHTITFMSLDVFIFPGWNDDYHWLTEGGRLFHLVNDKND